MTIKIELYPLTVDRAERFFIDMVRFGNHYNDDVRLIHADTLIKTLRDTGYPTEKVISELIANFEYQIPVFENLIGLGGWTTTSGGSIELDYGDGIKIGSSGAGAVAGDTFGLHFKAACEARDRAIERYDPVECLNMASRAFSSLHAFYDIERHRFLKKNPNFSGTNFDERHSITHKIKKWTPILTSGQKINTSHIGWERVLALQTLRNKSSEHPSLGYEINNLDALSRAIYDFRQFANMTFQIHNCFGKPSANEIIRAAHFPDLAWREV